MASHVTIVVTTMVKVMFCLHLTV